MNHEIEALVLAWMQRREMPAPVLLWQDDGTYIPLGKHDAAIVEAVRRLGHETMAGVYIVRCDDETKRLQLANATDALNEQYLKDSKESIRDGQHRTLLKQFDLN